MNKRQKNVLSRIIISFIICLSLLFFKADPKIELLLFLVPYLIVGYDVLYDSLRGLINRQPFDENFLMAIATVGAFFLGEYIEGVFVILLYQLGEFFQSYAVGKSRKNITELIDIRPEYTYIKNELNELEKTDPYKISIGDIVYAKPGDKIALDGVVEEGESVIDTSALTGESVPSMVKQGDTVLSGSINLQRVLKIRVTKIYEESTASKILDLVENSSNKKSVPEKFIRKFAKYYTPIVCLLAFLLATVIPLCIYLINGNNTFTEWLYRALSFLVISCPCALVISVPLTFFAGLGCASKNGILIKGSNYIEALAKAEYILFDKTGTLTKGTFGVVGLYDNTMPYDKVMEYVVLAETYSNHPISESLKKSYTKPLDKSRVSCFTEMSGCGISAKVDNTEVLVGNSKLMKENDILIGEINIVETVLHIAIDKKYEGYIIISDNIKDEAADSVLMLKNMGIKKTCILTGDKKSIAEKVGSKIGVDEVYSELLPADKVTVVESVISEKKKGTNVVFVGDGINDAPVLARVDVGIAMGALGSDAAIEAADVVLMDDSPKKVPISIKISKKCLSIVYQNIVFAIGVKVLFLLLSAFGLIGMMFAIFADVGVMLIAVFNAIRALKI